MLVSEAMQERLRGGEQHRLDLNVSWQANQTESGLGSNEDDVPIDIAGSSARRWANL